MFRPLLVISLPFLVATGAGRALALGLGMLWSGFSSWWLGWLPESTGQFLAMRAWLPRAWAWIPARLAGTLIFVALDGVVPADVESSMRWLLVWPVLAAVASIPETVLLATVDARAMLWPVVRFLARMADSGMRLLLIGLVPSGPEFALATTLTGFIVGMLVCALCLAFVGAPALEVGARRRARASATR